MEFLERGMKMLVISSYPPRECGIATFSIDIVKSIGKIFGDTLPIEVCALQDKENSFNYPSEVHYTLDSSDVTAIRAFANQLNERNDIGLICLQHEFGLFGGTYGNYILTLLLTLNKPVMTIFHSVIPKPNPSLKKVVCAIANLSEKIVVLTKNSQKTLTKHYSIQKSKTVIIPHGTHVMAWEQKEAAKQKYYHSGKTLLATFGLMSENKSIETVLYALPKIIEKHPKTNYLIIGKTHPEVLKTEGETYRNKLQLLVNKLNLETHVFFINEYLDLKQLLEFLSMTDIYVFTSKDPNQAVSGTLVYAMSCGCAIVSNPIPHAKEILKKDKGILLKNFNNTKDFQKAILYLQDHKEERLAIAKNAFVKSFASSWENVAIQYGLLFGEITDRTEDLRFNPPPLRLQHIENMTTEVGILQFSKFSEPDPESGYTLDDNARALINMCMYYKFNKSNKIVKLAGIYLNFIERMQRKSGWFDNYMDINQNLTVQNKEVNLEDANGRALWSLGYLLSEQDHLPNNLVQTAKKCFTNFLPNIQKIKSPRAIAYAIKGLYYYYLTNKEASIKALIEQFASILLSHYNMNYKENWNWFEDYMAYANNILPEAMLYCYLTTHNKTYKKIAEMSLDFLLANYFMKGQLKIVSNKDWFKRKNEHEFYGEQPIEVATTIICLDLFYRVTGKNKYKNQMELAFSWFLGNNHLKQIMYHANNGASFDGLEKKQININQGAESTLCFFKAQMILHQYYTSPTLLKNIKPLKSKSL